MKKKYRNALIGAAAFVMISSIGLTISNKMEQRKTEKQESIESKERADNRYYDSLTEDDIAWG